LLTAAPSPIESATQKDVEIQVEELFIISKAAPELPFQVNCVQGASWMCLVTRVASLSVADQ
jgi:hypothetical protein